MRITILTDNPKSWVIPFVPSLVDKLRDHEVRHIFSTNELDYGDIMLILSCEKLLTASSLKYHKSNVVVHPSKLPHGKGWSPLAWQVLEGINKIPVSLFEAVEAVDAGKIYLVDFIELEGFELNDEIKYKQGNLMIKMILDYISNFDVIVGTEQSGEETFYRKRIKIDNKLDINKSIKEQFNLLRIVDNDRYPAFFDFNGKTYTLKIFLEH